MDNKFGSKNVPVDEKLWAELQALAKGERNKPVVRGGESVNPVNDGAGFRTFPSAYANGWALAQYKRLGGKWKKEGSEFKMPRKWDKSHCEDKPCEDMGFSEKASCRPYKNCYGKTSAERVAERYGAKRDDPKLKNTGKGGLGTWFAGHGGGDPEDRATWGDWVAITPVKHTIKKEEGEDKTYEPGDIVGPCAVSSEKEWASVTGNGSKPLKCMPREKAWGMPKEDRAALARKKKTEEAKHKGKKPVNTPTFSEDAEKVKKGSDRVSDFHREVIPPDSLSSLSNGSVTNKDTNPDGSGSHSALPNGDSARNIGRPSPDSPNLKYRNLDKSEANGRTPANKLDMGYVNDSGSGSARVIPYDSGFANNSSSIRNAGLKALASKIAARYIQSAAQPAQDLGGVQTWVNKTRQDQIENDTSAPEKGRGDSEDGKPQRDRVLPLPDGHPKGRDEQRAGPPVMNTPSDSSGASTSYGKQPNPNAIPNQPDGKPLHQRPRSSGLPGDQYGHPYINQQNTTGMKRRTDDI